jgi:phenylalanyl-tRNA synthetase beta chain
LLDPIGFTTAPTDRDGAQIVAIPPWRPDCATEIDVIEEVGRHHGFANIAPVVAKSVHPGGLTDRQLDRRLVRQVLVGAGMYEAMPYPFLAPGDLERCGLDPDGLTITNPLASEESVLRTSLRPGLLTAVAYNTSHRSFGVRLFEVGHVYRRTVPTAPLPDEREQVAAVIAGDDARAAVRLWRELEAAIGLKGIEIDAGEAAGLHPGRTAALVHDSDVLGWVGEIDPDVLARFSIPERVAWLEVDLDAVLAMPRAERRYRRVSRYPSSDLDLAFLLADAIPAARLTAALRESAEDVEEVRLFDVYRGAGVPEGSRSLAYRLRIQAPDRTLTDTDLAAVRERAVEAAAGAGATLRG